MTYTGGHRFAPAMVLLPAGLTYGRIGEDAALDAVTAARRKELSLTGFRGRSCYTPVEQVAEIALLEQLSSDGRLPPENALSVAAVPDAIATGDPATFAGAALVTHPDGRRWLVTAHAVAHAPRQASCGAAPKPATAIVADEPRPLP